MLFLCRRSVLVKPLSDPHAINVYIPVPYQRNACYPVVSRSAPVASPVVGVQSPLCAPTVVSAAPAACYSPAPVSAADWPAARPGPNPALVFTSSSFSFLLPLSLNLPSSSSYHYPLYFTALLFPLCFS